MLGNFLIGFLTPYADDGIVYFFVFETKSLSLENVDIMYSDPSISARTSKKWVPAGYISRNERDDTYWERRHSAVGATGAAASEKVGDKDVDTSPERGMSTHHERV